MPRAPGEDLKYPTTTGERKSESLGEALQSGYMKVSAAVL